MSGERPASWGSINKLRWQITAPPRSGTTWIAKWLTQHGYPTTHERCFLTVDRENPARFKPHQCRQPGDSSWLAAPWCWELKARGIKVIHLRRPLEDIAASMYRLQWNLADGGTTFQPVLEHFTPGVFTEEPNSYEQFLRFATEWSELIDADTVWDLYDVGDKELKWLKEAVE